MRDLFRIALPRSLHLPIGVLIARRKVGRLDRRRDPLLLSLAGVRRRQNQINARNRDDFSFEQPFAYPLQALARGRIGDFVRISLRREHRPNLRSSLGQQFESGLFRPAEQKSLDHRELHFGARVALGDRRGQLDTFRPAPHR